MATTSRYVGTCAVCGKTFKVREAKLVHHGYKRPGDGFIVGDCFAVHMPPHQTSPMVAEQYRELALREISDLEKSRAQTLVAEELSYAYTVYETLGYRSQKVPRLVIIKRGECTTFVDGNRLPSFDDHQLAVLGNLARRLEMAQREVERMDWLLKDWQEQPLTTQEEETQRVTAEKLAARAEKKAQRDAAKAGKEARDAERAAKYQAKIDAARVKAQTILDAVDPTNVQGKRISQSYART